MQEPKLCIVSFMNIGKSVEYFLPVGIDHRSLQFGPYINPRASKSKAHNAILMTLCAFGFEAIDVIQAPMS